jgi:integrase/recombinase XerD
MLAKWGRGTWVVTRSVWAIRLDAQPEREAEGALEGLSRSPGLFFPPRRLRIPHPTSVPTRRLIDPDAKSSSLSASYTRNSVLRHPEIASEGISDTTRGMWSNTLNLSRELPISLVMSMLIRKTSSPVGKRESDELIALPAERPDRDPARVYLAGLAAGSRRSMAQALDQVARIASGGQAGADDLPWAALRYKHTQAIRAALRDLISPRTGRPLSPGSINKTLCALRGVLREAWRLGLMSAEDYHRAADLEPVHGATVLRGRALEGNEVAALFHVLQRDHSIVGARDAAVLALGLAGGGLRRAELCRADLPNDLDQNSWVLTVVGKGNHIREVPLKNGTVDALRAWLSHRGNEPGPLICPVLKGGKIQYRRLSEQAIYKICAKRAEEAGIPTFSPHDMRRTYISTLLDRGVDLSVVSKLCGHRSGPNVTARYDRRGERAKHAAAEAIALPYVFKE